MKTVILTTILLINLFANQQSQAQCDINDWTALKALYESTNGDNWTNRTGWDALIDNQTTPPLNCILDDLHGIDLDDEGRVHYIKLSKNNLNGNIPPELDGLNNLDTLLLNNNTLIGNIPLEIFNLSKLKNIWLSYNSLSGNIPAEVGDLINLTSLSMSNNNFIGSIPTSLGNLTDLERLSLHNNQLTGNIPSVIGSLDKLKNLYLYKNKLTGSIPTEIANLVYLIELDFSFNKLAGSIPVEFGRLINLKEIWLSHNQLTGSIPAEFGNLLKLDSLGMQKNQLSGSIPTELGKLINLTFLRLSENQLIGTIPVEFGNLDSLGYLSLHNNQLSGRIPATIGNLNKLSYLYLYNNQLTDSIPKSIGNLTNLVNLDLSINQLSGSIPTELGNLDKLTELWLSDNDLTGRIPAEFGNLNSLRELGLHRNQLIGNIPTEFGNLNNLTFLRLSHNQLTGIPAELNNLSKLTYLNLSYNNFSCHEFQKIFDLKQRFIYLPQYFEPENYGDIISNVFDTINQSLKLDIKFPFDTTGYTYQWYHNGEILLGATQAILNLDCIQPNNVGKYTLYLKDENCLLNDFKSISEPIYIILKGYDLYGQPVEYNQIMVAFDCTEETKKYEEKILTKNAGWVEKACNCNRELYLWQFPSTEAAIDALLTIDEKTRRLKSKTRPKGGFNNNLNIGETINTPKAYNILSEYFGNIYPDSVSVFLLDSGLDKQNFNASSFLNSQAKVDDCYGIEKSTGYSYIDSIAVITTNYLDEVWHGTFGFRSITYHLKGNTNLNMTPLKIFNKNGEGTLFNMVCALYHAIDNNADIVNISAGYQGEPSDILESAIDLAREKGIFITVAVGNDTINIDNLPQYPAYYAGQYSLEEFINGNGAIKYDTLYYDNVISVASLNVQNELSQFSNFGKQSVTIACYGENIHSYGLEGLDVVASGTSMSTFFATKALALEKAKDRNRNYQEIWKDFEMNWLIDNPLLLTVTQTGKQIDFDIEEALIKGCTDPYSSNYFEFANEDDGSCIEIGFEIYPNPSDGIVNLGFYQNTGIPKKIIIFDVVGKIILKQDSVGDIIQLNLQDYSKGIYFIKATLDNKTIVQKLILK